MKTFAATALLLLSDHSVLFGHGIWCALLFRRLTELAIAGSEDTVASRHFRHKLAMPNGAVCALVLVARASWTTARDAQGSW